MTKMLYWAYGSNLDRANMAERCPRAVYVGPLTVNDAALVFRGVADVTVRKGSVVPGGLWEITKECEEALDRYEGVSSRLYLKRYLSVKIGGKVRRVLFYQMSITRGIMPPSEAYLKKIEAGYRDFGLNPEVLVEAVQRSYDDKELTVRMKDRHRARGNPKLAPRPGGSGQAEGDAA